MKIPLGVAQKLLLLLQGETLSAGSIRHPIKEELIQERILVSSGKVRKKIKLLSPEALANYLYQQYDIDSLTNYINVIKKEEVNRAELATATTDSKHRQVRTFKGFLINSYMDVACIYRGKPLQLIFTDGFFQFISNFEEFTPNPSITIVGVENAETFRHISQYKYLFQDIRPLFVSRYPQNQSKDLIAWLKQIPNSYLHFGDYDFAGINIYLSEYRKHLPEKASFFIPDDIEEKLIAHGSRKLYNNQQLHTPSQNLPEENLKDLVLLIHRFKKGLEQEVFGSTNISGQT